MVQVVVLSANGESRTLKTQAFATGAATGADVAKALRKTKPYELIGAWTWEERVIQLWGAKEGKAGTENKHELPPPYDEILLFGDSIVCDQAGDLTAEVWAELYEEAFGGFESIGSEDSDDEEGGEAEEAEEEAEVEEEVEEEIEEEVEEEAEEEEEEEAEAEAEVEEADDEAEGEDGDEDYEDDGGAAKRRATRRRTAADSEYKRMEMGAKVRVKYPAPVGKRAPRWMTAPELVSEPYEI
jgi:hypothetical protein